MQFDVAIDRDVAAYMHIYVWLDLQKEILCTYLIFWF